jgi:hypothetical protein
MKNWINFSVILISIIVLSCNQKTSISTKPDILSYEEYSQKDIVLPYILNIKKGNKHLIYYGTKHSYNPGDKMFSEIEDLFTNLLPDIAFNEGGNNWPVINDRDSTIKLTGDPGFIRYLSRKNNVPVTSIDPPDSLEYTYLLSKYQIKDILLMYFCRQIEQLQHQGEMTDQEFNEDMSFFIKELKESGMPLSSEQSNIDFIIEYYESFFNRKFIWKEFDPTNYQPIYSKTVLNEIMRESTYFRDRYMVTKIEEALKSNDKVFVVMGGSHLVIQEPVLRHILNQYE